MRLLPLLLIAILVLIPSGQMSAQDVRPTTLWERIQYSNGIAAVVEDRIITIEELRREITPLLRQIQREATSVSDFENRVELLGREVLQNLVDRILTVKEFEKDGFQVPQSYIENEFDDFIAKHYNNDRAQFLQHLKAQGQTIREFRKQLQERLIVSYMRGRFRRSISEVSPEKIEKFYDENRDAFFQEESVLLKQIMLFANPSSKAIGTDALEVTARKISDQLDNGASFSELAKKYSQDEKAKEGGAWGWINRSDIREELANVAFSLSEGAHSDPIILEGNIFILYVEEKREEGLQPLEHVRSVIEETLIDDLTRQAQQRWLDRLRKDAYTRIYI